MKFVALTTLPLLLLAVANFQVSVEAGLLRSVLTQINSTFYDLGNGIMYKAAYDIVEIPVTGDPVSTMSLALGTLCQAPVVDQYLVCFACNQDCLRVHNTYGGTCAPNPNNPGKITCLCADTQEEATARGISADSRATCNATAYPNSVAATLDNDFFFPVLRTRMAALQCLKTGNIPNPSGYNNTGCSADCYDNHGYTAQGNCTKATPKVPYSRYTESQPDFCECKNAAPTTTTTTTSTPAP